MPLDLVHPHDIKEWSEQTVEHYQHNPEFKYTYMTTHFWKLEYLSCVLVCRNRQWFNDNIGQLDEIWSTIEKERVSGYEHRAPNRKPKKETISISTNASSNGCLLQFNKETGKITVVKKDIEPKPESIPVPIPIPDLNNIVIDFKNDDS